MDHIESGIKKLRVNSPRASVSSCAAALSPPSHHLRSIQHRRRTIGACGVGGVALRPRQHVGVGSVVAAPLLNPADCVSKAPGGGGGGLRLLEGVTSASVVSSAASSASKAGLRSPLRGAPSLASAVVSSSVPLAPTVGETSPSRKIPLLSKALLKTQQQHMAASAAGVTAQPTSSASAAASSVAAALPPPSGLSLSASLPVFTVQASQPEQGSSNVSTRLLNTNFGDEFSDNMSDFASLRINDESSASTAQASPSSRGLVAPAKLSHQTKAFISHRGDPEPRLTESLRREMSSCSVQAANASVSDSAAVAAMVADDVTAEELAGYLDELLHLPKKMSPMAEMMYT